MTTLESIPTIEFDAKTKLDILYELSKKIGTVPELPLLLEQIIEMTQKALRAAAASILLFRENGQDLYFEAATGPVGKELKAVKIDSQNSIAGQVIQTGKPVIVNNVKSHPNFGGSADKTTGFTTKSIICAPLVTHQKTIGVLEVLNKLDGTDFDESDTLLLVPVAVTAAMAIENTRLHQTLLDAYEKTVLTLVEIIDAKDPYTRGHSQRVMQYALLAAPALSFSPEKTEALKYAGIFHDVGKIAVDSHILNKPGKLTPPEWNIIREHPAIGATIVKKIPFLEKVSQFVLHHHEWYNGSGYPDGLKGEDIPLEARVLSVADAFDTMTTDRSYRTAYSIERAINELKKDTGTQFCPVAVEAFITGFESSVNNARTLLE